MAFLIGCTKIAKEYNDDFLTKRIEEEKKNKQKEQTAKITKAATTIPTAQLDSPNTVEKKSSALPNKRPKQ